MLFNQRVLTEIIIGTIPPLLLFLLTLIVGQRIIAYWDKVKKRQEFDVATSKEFHRLYGEFKQLTKLWRTFYRTTHKDFAAQYKKKYDGLSFPAEADVRRELLRRATAAESELEAVMIKIATERQLDNNDRKNLGNFRQGYEQLRHSIRRNSCPSFSDFQNPKYHLFDALACKAANIISEGEPSVPPRWVLRPLKRKTELDLQAINQLQSIKQGGHEAWEVDVSNFVNGVSAKHTDSRPCPETAAWQDGGLMESESPS